MKRKQGVIVATRKLSQVGGKQRFVIVKIGKPRKQKQGDWECPYHINGIGTQKVMYGHGIDSVQALVMALEGVRTTLEKSTKKLSWAGGEPEETGFTRFVPTFYGLKFSKHLHRLIEREILRFARLRERKRGRQLS